MADRKADAGRAWLSAARPVAWGPSPHSLSYRYWSSRRSVLGRLEAVRQGNQRLWGEAFVADLGIGLIGGLASIPAYALMWLGGMSLSKEFAVQGRTVHGGRGHLADYRGPRHVRPGDDRPSRPVHAGCRMRSSCAGSRNACWVRLCRTPFPCSMTITWLRIDEGGLRFELYLVVRLERLDGSGIGGGTDQSPQRPRHDQQRNEQLPEFSPTAKSRRGSRRTDGRS